jgi:hypothetical protein
MHFRKIPVFFREQWGNNLSKRVSDIDDMGVASTDLQLLAKLTYKLLTNFYALHRLQLELSMHSDLCQYPYEPQERDEFRVHKIID